MAEKKSARERGVTVEQYVKKLAAPQQEAFAILKAIVAKAAPKATVSIKWGQPVWESNGPMIFCRGASKHLTFGFWRGAEIEARGFEGLEGSGDVMRHLKLAGPDAIDRKAIAKMVAIAVELNATKGDPTKRA
jgi:hypothetical protein